MMQHHDSAKLDQLAQWYTHHFHSLVSSLRDLLKKPLANFMTLMVIGIAVALPAGLYVLLQNMQELSQRWYNSASISFYLKRGTPDYKIATMIDELKKSSLVKNAKYISPEQGLKDFQQMTQFGNALTELKQNPLPGVIIVTPAEHKQTPNDLKRLVGQFQLSPFVDIAQIDLAWVQRLYYILSIGKRITYSLALLFGLGVLLIIGNTIRLTVEHHYEEMVILKLVGATNAFIRRPFLYRGLFYGFFGGVVSWLLLGIMLSWLTPPARALSRAYDQTFLLKGLPLSSVLFILAFSSTLGIIGAWLATNRQLRTLN